MIQIYHGYRFFARITAILLVAAISVGTTLPLVWCFDGDNHSAIEVKVGGTSTISLADQPDRHTVQHASLAAEDQYHPNDCVDLDAVPPAALVNESDAPTVDWVDVPAPLAGELICGARSDATARNTSGPRLPAVSTSPALIQLKTVILLI